MNNPFKLVGVLGIVVIVGLLALRGEVVMKTGQSVVFVGDTFAERAQEYGYLEAVFSASFPGEDIKFRNLGWSADTVRGLSRAGFDHLQPEPGWSHLLNSLKEADPDWVMVAYGMAESFAGPGNLGSFEAGYRRLIAEIKSISPEKPVRFILLSPIAHEFLPGELPDPGSHNRDLRLYADTIRSIAGDIAADYVDLYSWMRRQTGSEKLTDNGIHLNELGYKRAARHIGQSLGLSAASVATQIPSAQEPQSHVVPLAPIIMVQGGDGLDQNESYVLRVNGEPVLQATGGQWQSGMAVESGALAEKSAELARLIQQKNRLFFYRWRPQNNTYLFLFRKHEQGQNAREIPMFDPLIDEMESRILQAKQPVEIEMAFELAGAGSAERMSSPDQPAVQANRSVIPGFENPTQSVPEFSTDAGIEIKLFATNPFLAKPIHMNFDSQGRLWVASSEVYPQIEPGQSANDKIIVLEDTDGDGIADESRIFADGLLIPTGVEPGDGGVYVGHSTELIHLKDTDGDGIADRKRIILSGFGTEDTHHILHSLRWGPDGLLYMNQSIYIHTHMETPHGVVRLNSGGVIHLRPSTMEAGVYVKGFCNPWGHHFDPFGQSFITDGAGYQGISLAVPGAMYFTYAGAPRLMDSISPGSYPKYCGLELIRSPHFPADWQGDAITCDFRAHKVVRFAMNEKDSAYVTTQMPDVVATGDVTFRPIDVKLGPDGALYIADWSNPIIQHGEVDFRDPRRDHVNGRIWRVSYKGSTPAPKQDLTTEPNKILLDSLLSPLGFQREKSRRVLTERGQAILPDLEDWVRTHRDHPSKLEALWIYQSLNLVEPGILSELLRSPAHKIRAAALRIVAHWKSRLPMDFQWQSALSDVHPQVRMEALRTLAAQPVSAADMQKALTVLDHPMDHHLEYSLWLTINDLDQVWRSAVLESRMDPTAMAPDRLAYVLQALPAKSAGDVLSQVLSENQFSPEASGPWVQIIGQAGTIREIDLIHQKLTSGFFNTSGQEKVLQALNQAARSRRLVPRGPLSGLGAFLQSQNPSVRLAAIPLAGAWKDIREAFSSLAQIPSDQTRSQSERTSAIQALREIGGAGALNALKSASQGERNADLPLRVEATRALATLDTEVAWSQALPLFSESLDDNQALVLWRALLQLKDAGTRLEPWVRGSTLPPRIAELGVRAAQEGGRQLPGLIIALNQAGKLESATQLSAGDLADLARQILQSGDPHLGESVYRRTELGCRTCHAIGGIGGKLGPDMTSIGASAPMDYLIESLYFPNAKIKEGYHAVNIDTIAELTYSGTLVREDADQVWLRDAASKIVQVPKDEIVSRTMADYSLMPSGLLNGLSVVDKVNLFAFLSQLGKSGDFDASRADKARRWFLYPATIDAAQFGEDIILKTDLADNASWRGGWKPFDTLVGGRLLQSDLKQRLQDVASRFPNKLYAGCLFQVAQDGTSEFSLQGFDHAECAAWIDGQPVPINHQKQSLAARLGPGKHTLILSLPVKELPEFIQVTCPSVTFVVE